MQTLARSNCSTSVVRTRQSAAARPCNGLRRVVVRAQPFVDTAEVETLSNLLTANPLAAGAGVSVLGLAGVVGSIFGNGKVSTVSAQQAYDLLLNEERVALLDIRSKVAAKAGTPDLREAKKKVLSLPYTQVADDVEVVVEDFVEAFQAARSIPEDALLVLIDEDGSLAGRAAAALAGADVTQPKLYVVKGGAAAWQAAELPWRESSSFMLPSLPSLGSLPESLEELAESYKANPSLGKTALALGAIIGSGVFIVNEADVLLELAGAIGVGQLVYKNLLFADDREKTLGKLRNFLVNTGADTAGEELKQLARNILAKAEAAAAEAAATSAATATTTEPQPADAGAAAAATPAVAAAGVAMSAEVPENVASAREWIAAWRARGTAAEPAPAAATVAEAASDDAIAENVASARVWISNWRARSSQRAAQAALEAASAQVAAAMSGEVPVVPAKEKEVVLVQ